MAKRSLLTGVAYHGNRMPSHVKADMKEISKCRCEAEFAFAVPHFVTAMKLAEDKLVLTIAYDYSRPDFASMDAAARAEAVKAWKELIPPFCFF